MGSDKKHAGVLRIKPIRMEELYRYVRDVKARICVDEDRC